MNKKEKRIINEEALDASYRFRELQDMYRNMLIEMFQDNNITNKKEVVELSCKFLACRQNAETFEMYNEIEKLKEENENLKKENYILRKKNGFLKSLIKNKIFSQRRKQLKNL